jgi:hypothetical protein
MLLGLAFCTEQNRILVHTAAIDDHTNPDVGEDIEFLHVPTAGFVAQKPGFFAVHDANEWLFIWKDPRHDAQPPPAPREIDFNKEMLFVATSQNEGAQSIDVKKIIGQSSGIHIYVVEMLGGPGCPVKSNAPPPMDIVTFRPSSFDIHVHYDRLHAQECGPPPDAIALCRNAGAGLPGHDKIVATPGETVDCDASSSRPHAGSLVDRGWQLTSVPPGSTSKLTVGNQGRGVTIVPDAWGTYILGLEVRDEARTGWATATIDVPPPTSGIPLELHWSAFDRTDDSSMFPRVELHVAEIGSASADCSPATAKSWCEVHVTGNVQQAMLRPEPGKTYRTYVSYQDFRLKGSPVACVRTFPNGRPSLVVCDESLRSAGASWELGALDDATSTFYDPKKGKPTQMVMPPVVPSATPSTRPVAPPRDAGAAIVAPEHKNPF